MQVLKTGNANHKVIIHGEKEFFTSYQSVIAVKYKGKISLSEHWDYSRTTVKHLVNYLGLKDSKELRKLIKEGKFLRNINTKGEF